MTKIFFCEHIDVNAPIVKSKKLNALVSNEINCAGVDSNQVKLSSHRNLDIYFLLFSRDQEDFNSRVNDIVWHDLGVSIWPKSVKPRGCDWIEFYVSLNYQWYLEQPDALAAYLKSLDICLRYLTDKSYTTHCLEIPNFWDDLYVKAINAKDELSIWSNRTQDDHRYLRNKPVVIL